MIVALLKVNVQGKLKREKGTTEKEGIEMKGDVDTRLAAGIVFAVFAVAILFLRCAMLLF